MSYTRVRLKITDTKFPLLSQFAGRTILLQTKEELGQDVAHNAPGMLYCENVMPTNEGLKSIDFLQAVPPMSVADGSYLSLIQFAYNQLSMSYADLATVHLATPYSQWGLNFIRVLEVRGSGEIRAYIGITALGILFISTKDNNTWIPLNNEGWSPTIAEINSVSIAVVIDSGETVTYICLPSFGIYKVDIIKKLLTKIAFRAGSDINVTKVLGIVSSYNYLILHNGQTLQWSSAFDPLDFGLANSIITGAGFGTPIGLQGQITALVTNPAGFTVYSDVNAVSVDWSSNVQFPWVFRPIPNSSGVVNNRMVVVSEENINYAWTNNGLQAIDTTNAKTIFPEVTDFLTFNKLETYNHSTNTIQVTSGKLTVDIGYAGSRYMIISYGVDVLVNDNYNVVFIPTVSTVDTATINGVVVSTPELAIGSDNTHLLLGGTLAPDTPIFTFVSLQVANKEIVSWTITLHDVPPAEVDPSHTFKLYDTANNVISTIVFAISSPVYPIEPISITATINFQGFAIDRVELTTLQNISDFSVVFTARPPSKYSQALIYDISLKRWGKIVLDHVDTVDYRLGEFNSPRSGIGFLLSTGEIQVVDFKDRTCPAHILNRDNFVVDGCTPGVWNATFDAIEANVISIFVQPNIPPDRPELIRIVEVYVTVYIDTPSNVRIGATCGAEDVHVNVPALANPTGDSVVGIIEFATFHPITDNLTFSVFLSDFPDSSSSPVMVVTDLIVS